LTLIIALLTTATAWADNVVTLSVDGDIAEGTAGHYYVNMPATGTKTLTLTEQDITDGKGTFKVYDDGGKDGNYSASCNGYLTIVVPENCTLQLSGEVKLTRTNSTNESSANPIFKIFNGGSTGTQIASVWGSTNYGPGYERNIGTLDSSSNTITLYLYNDKTPGYSNSNASGVDITVTVISPDMEYAVNIADGILNGSVTADPTSAEGGTTISLTAEPESGYLLNGISVTDANSNAVGITCAPWYASGDAANKAMFTMPKSAVTVTPTFSAITDTDAFSIRVPKTGAEAATIPDGIVSFKVYDNGGPGGSYGPDCDGTLTLTAPTGWGLQVAGSVDVTANESVKETVTITDGTNRLYSANYTTETMNPVIISSGTLTIAIKSDNSDFHYGRAGIDLTVTMVDLSQPHSVTVGSASNGSMTASPVSVTAGTPVTLTAVPASGYRLGSVTVTYDGDKPVTANGTGNERTFTMPYADVTVTPVFEPANADGGPIISGLNYVGSNGDAPGYYVINSASALNALATYVNSGNSAEGMLFRQTADIDMQGAGFTPIGDDVDHPFTGTFDGDGYVILNISNSNNSATGGSGLFGRLVGTAKNVSLKDCSFSGVRAGGIAGVLYGGHIVNCNVLGGTAYCPAGGYSGGIVGYVGSSYGGEVGGCFTTATVSAAAVDPQKNGSVAGHPAGWIHDNYYTVSVSGGDAIYGTLVTVYGITLGDGITMTGNFRTVGRTAANTYRFGRENDAITLSHNRAGYAVNYSCDDVTITDGTFTMPASDVSVSATFTPITYTITYNGTDGATFSIDKNSYTVESEAITLDTPTKTGYDFGGWYDNAALTGDPVTTIAAGSTGDVTLWAKWTVIDYTITYILDGVTTDAFTPTTYNVESAAITLAAPTRTGYTFSGWHDNDALTGDAVTTIAAGSTGNRTLYAQWVANTYTVHFEPVIPVNGEMADQTFTYDAAQALTKNAFSTTTGEWLGWNTEADGSGTAYEDEQEVQNLTAENGATVTLYAQWRLQHRVRFDASIFNCIIAGDESRHYFAYPGESVQVRVLDNSSQYTISVTGDDGTDITFNTTDNTFTMPDQQVWVSATSVKKMAYTSILLDGSDYSDIVYLYDASNPTVTPTVTVKDGETVLTEGTDYTVEIANNTGSATQMVTATVTVTGMGGYVGTNTTEFRITPFNIANCDVRGTLEAYDNGYGFYDALSENVEVWNGETQLTLYTDYSLDIEYSDTYEIGQTYQATVTGMGDWGGTKTFTFTCVALHHTVVFDANGGSGTMAGGTVENDGGYSGIYYLPECTFTAPEGKVFDHWEASCEEGEEKQPGDYFTAPYIFDEYDVQTITVTAYWRDALILLDDDSNQPVGSKNADIIAANDGTTDLTVQLQGRTLYKDGKWNTLCLPFALSAEQIAVHADFSGATLMELDTDGKNGFDTTDGTLWLTFKKATAISAGVPYLVKWDAAGTDFTSPTFSGVTISATASTTATGTSAGLEEVQMVGCFSPVAVTADDKSILFLGEANTLYYSTIDRDIRSCRAYFSVPYIKQHAQAHARAFRLDFGEGDASGIVSVSKEAGSEGVADAWYTLDGRRLSGKPTAKGLYIYGSKKVMIK